jgi:hypothetical protein
VTEMYTMNGIIGIRPALSYSAIKERCCARISGYDKVVAHLPFETVDAVFTSRGLLIHRNVRDELQAVSIPDHENLWKIACGETVAEARISDSRISAGSECGGPIPRGTITRDKLVAGSLSVEDIKAEDARTFEQVRMIVRHMMADMVKKEVIPLTARIEELRRQNQRLADKIQALEDRDAQGNKPEAAGIQEFKGEAIERQWGENGGLPTFLHEPGNPFCKQRR